MSVEFFYDCSSPFTYLGFHNIQIMARELGVDILWRPFLVGGVFNSINQGVYTQRAAPVPAKDAYHRKDIQDWARLAGLRIVYPPRVFPVNSVKTMRGCILLAGEGKEIAFARAAFEAHWRDDEDIGRDEVLAGLCRAVDVDPAWFFDGIRRPAVKDALRASTAELIRRGGFGSPTMFVGGADMYFGNDRIALVRDAILRSRRGAAATTQGSAI
jgi:2-hydroxychromene-2-carboxylate isomerase